MERYIKYKRIVKKFYISNSEKIQEFFDELIKDGYEIIYYHEEIINMLELQITLVIGKKQES